MTLKPSAAIELLGGKTNRRGTAGLSLKLMSDKSTALPDGLYNSMKSGELPNAFVTVVLNASTSLIVTVWFGTITPGFGDPGVGTPKNASVVAPFVCRPCETSVVCGP